MYMLCAFINNIVRLCGTADEFLQRSIKEKNIFLHSVISHFVNSSYFSPVKTDFLKKIFFYTILSQLSTAVNLFLCNKHIPAITLT